jgi:hypothetical protein
MHYPAFNISLNEITSCNTQDFYKLYEIYAQAFPLEDEREPPEAFKQILEFNKDKELHALYGSYYEVVAAIDLNGVGTIGGMIFGCTTSPAHIEAGISASIQAIYAFLSPDYRGILPMRIIADYCRKKALEIFSGNGSGTMFEPIILFEVNSPLRMSAEQIAEDTLYSGINPAQRYMFWQRAIYSMPLNFSYVQPRLRDDSQPIHYLDLFCTKELPQGIPAKVLLNHLKAFCSISVLKAKDASLDPDFHTMEKWLNEQETVFFMDKNSTEINDIKKLKRS